MLIQNPELEAWHLHFHEDRDDCKSVVLGLHLSQRYVQNQVS